MPITLHQTHTRESYLLVWPGTNLRQPVSVASFLSSPAIGSGSTPRSPNQFFQRISPIECLLGNELNKSSTLNGQRPVAGVLYPLTVVHVVVSPRWLDDDPRLFVFVNEEAVVSSFHV